MRQQADAVRLVTACKEGETLTSDVVISREAEDESPRIIGGAPSGLYVCPLRILDNRLSRRSCTTFSSGGMLCAILINAWWRGSLSPHWNMRSSWS